MPSTNVTRTSFQLSVRAPNDIVERINRYGERLKASTGADLSQAQVILTIMRHGLDVVEKQARRHR